MSISTVADLSGPWKVALVDAELRRSGADPDLDDSAWPTIEIPGHWAERPEFDQTHGPILHRRAFSVPPSEEPSARTWLVFDGVTAKGDVWLDGHYVGDTDGYFVPHRFEITDHVRDGGDHLLSVEVVADHQGESRSKHSLTGSLQAGPLAPPGSPGGIWQPVRIERTGPVAVQHARLLCTHADADRATLAVRLVLDAADAATVTVHTGVTSPDGHAVAGDSVTHDVAKGENRIEWTIEIDTPDLWWPASLGSQPLYDVSVALHCETTEEEPPAEAEPTQEDPPPTRSQLSDRRHWRLGLRSVSVDDFTWRVNGVRLFVKGISVGPQHRFLGRLDDDAIREDVRAVKTAGLDLVRVHGHIAPRALYEETDQLGLLVWQDLPLVGGYATSARKSARATAREAVDLLGHHPSVAVWCAHDEPNGEVLPQPPGPTSERLPSFSRSLGRHLLPSWNRSVLDPIIRRELRAADESRSVISRSGSLPMLTDTSASDAHLWLGWHNGHYEDLAEVLRSWPKLGVFLGGFGAQSVAIKNWDEDEPTWQTAQDGAFQRYLPRRAYADGLSWAMATQAYQADLIRSQIETLRRVKYRPAGGFCVMALADAEEAGGFGVLDHNRAPKPAYHALTDACRPVIIVTDAPPPITTAGDELSFDVHAISDLHERLSDVHVTATAACGDWQTTRTWIGDLAEDSCMLVGRLDFEVPDLNGPLTIDLELRAGTWIATNRLQTVVIPPSETLRSSNVGQR